MENPLSKEALTVAQLEAIVQSVKGFLVKGAHSQEEIRAKLIEEVWKGERRRTQLHQLNGVHTRTRRRLRNKSTEVELLKSMFEKLYIIATSVTLSVEHQMSLVSEVLTNFLTTTAPGVAVSKRLYQRGLSARRLATEGGLSPSDQAIVTANEEWKRKLSQPS